MNASLAIRQRAIRTANEHLARNPVYLDTETTGLGEYDEIVDICIVEHDGTILFDSLVRPTRRISVSASQVHGIFDSTVTTAPTWPEIWPQVRTILEQRAIGIYNAGFDLRILRQTNDRHGLRWTVPKQNAFCIMKLYAEYYGQWNPRYGSYRWQSLEAAGRQCRIPLPNAHRAKDDALLARAVLHHVAGTHL